MQKPQQKIKIYGQRDCGVCDKARKECDKFGIDYEYYDRSIRKYYLECVEGKANTNVIPNIFVDNEYIGDYKSLLEFLKEKRYGSKD